MKLIFISKGLLSSEKPNKNRPNLNTKPYINLESDD